MSSEIILRELEWYIRDFFFRLYKKDNFIDPLHNNKITKNLIDNYLRYRDENYDDLDTKVNTVLLKLQEKNVLKMDQSTAIIELYSKFERMQCIRCFYINYISIKEIPTCQRCSSENLQEFPKKKKISIRR